MFCSGASFTFAYARLILAYAQMSFEYPSDSDISQRRSPPPLAAIPAAWFSG